MFFAILKKYMLKPLRTFLKTFNLTKNTFFLQSYDKLYFYGSHKTHSLLYLRGRRDLFLRFAFIRFHIKVQFLSQKRTGLNRPTGQGNIVQGIVAVLRHNLFLQRTRTARIATAINRIELISRKEIDLIKRKFIEF